MVNIFNRSYWLSLYKILFLWGFKINWKYVFQTDIAHSNHQNTWNLSTLRAFCIKISISNCHYTFKSSKHLKSYDFAVVFILKIHFNLTLHIQIIQTLEIFRRCGFFHAKYRLQTDIKHLNHQNTWDLTTLRLFSFWKSISIWHCTFKSSKHLKSFDVAVFFMQNIDCKLTLNIQIIKTLENFRRCRFLLYKISIANWH